MSAPKDDSKKTEQKLDNTILEDDDDSDSDSEDDELDLEPSLKNIMEQKSLRWIFVGGKGGVGKTTTSCSLSVMLAQKREKVLIISTDPAHNLSDAFGQQFGSKPRQVKEIPNLYGMEIDPKVDFSEVSGLGDNDLVESKTMSFISELSSSIPGIDEAMSFAELIKQVNKQDFDTIVFDTAPTGHTLRLLSFPTILQKALGKLDGLRNKFGGLLGNLGNLMGGNNNNNRFKNVNKDQIFNKLEEMKKNVSKIKKQFENSDLTTFVCVCIPEFLSLYETERLAQCLAKFGIDTHNIVINQVLVPEKDGKCKRCESRVKMQSKYIKQFHDLYPDFHLVKIPLMSEEVRHIKKLKVFAKLLLNPYNEMKEEEQEKILDVD